jgi:hypothetical protein
MMGPNLDSYRLADDNLFDALRAAHLSLPKTDWTALFVCISCVMIIIALAMVYYAIRLRSYSKDVNGEKKRSSWRIAAKLLLLLTALTMIFFASYSKRRIAMKCRQCGVEYSYTETRCFGKLLELDGFQTWWNPAEIYNGRQSVMGDWCLHSFAKSVTTKYWGGMIPVLEYLNMFPEGGAAPASAYIDMTDEQGTPMLTQRKPPTPITREMKFHRIKGKDGQINQIIIWPPKDESEVEQENMETSEQIQEIESFGNNSFGNLDNSKLESFGDPNDQPMGGGYGDFGESSQQITENTGTQFGEIGAKLLFFSWHDLGKSLSLRVKKNYRKYQRGRY